MISLQTIGLFIGVAAVVSLLVLLWLKRDNEEERRHELYIELSQICKEEGLTFVARLLKYAAIEDLSGMYRVVQEAKATLSDPAARTVHFRELLKIQIAKADNAGLVVAKAQEIQQLEAAQKAVARERALAEARAEEALANMDAG